MNANKKEMVIVSIIAFSIGILGILLFFLRGELIFILGTIMFMGMGLFSALMIPKAGKSAAGAMALPEFFTVITCFSILGLVILLVNFFEASLLGRLYFACGMWAFAVYNAYEAHKIHAGNQEND